MFELSMGHTAPPPHCISLRWGSQHRDHLATAYGATLLSPTHNPPCARRRASTAGPWQGEKISWAACIRTPSSPSGTWQIFWRPKAPVQRRGESRSSCGVAWIGSAWIKGCRCGKSGLSSHGLVCRDSLHNVVPVLVAYSGHHHLHHRELDSGIFTRVVEKK